MTRMVHDDGTEVTPMSIQDYYAKGMGSGKYFENYAMSKTPDNVEEKIYQDNLRAKKVAAIEKQIAELREMDKTGYPRTKSVLTELADNEDMVIS